MFSLHPVNSPLSYFALLSVVCADGDLRLVGGLSEYEGKLEMCYNEVWGTVCDGFWNQRASEVACRQRFKISDNGK